MTTRLMTACVTPEAAFAVAHFVEKHLDTDCPTPNRKEWEDVVNALYALANDTDAIITDPAVLG